MQLTNALIIYLIVVVLTYIIAKSQSIALFSSVVLALLVGQIILSIVRPITSVATFASENQTAVAIYMGVMFLTPLVLVIYVFVKASADKVVKTA